MIVSFIVLMILSIKLKANVPLSYDNVIFNQNLKYWPSQKNTTHKDKCFSPFVHIISFIVCHTCSRKQFVTQV